ncbi:DNA-directed RNA polymerase subunit K [Candidatus Woesearchaeota archaeon]|nr:DNA-directed RNA polymerase subunit K [Candidatus Woesearchaeota archaeon]
MEKGEKYTKYEKARMLGARAMQIAMGAPSLIKFSEEELKQMRYSPLDIA